MANQKTKTRKRRKVVKKKPSLLKSFFIILLVLFVSTIAIEAYMFKLGYLVFNPKPKVIKKKKVAKKKPIDDDKLLAKLNNLLEKKKQKVSKELEKAKNQKVVKKQTNTELNKSLYAQKPTEVEDYLQSTSQEKEKQKPRKKQIYKGKPKLAIVIDDVSFSEQTKKIKKIPYKVTPSFLPPTKRHPQTPLLAKQFPFHMVHLPLEAQNYGSPENKTLRKGTSYENIKKRIIQVKRQFPKAKYYNNHTGSKFTSDTPSMDRLFKVLKEENLLFLDSKTTNKSKADIMAKKYNMPTLGRDVFLDNSYEPKAIIKQLKYSVRVAKDHGYAIAICHPHASTLEVLKNAKSLLKDVELVYLNELP